jgi:uncharacterized protein YlxP (DUF503 family)
MMVGVLRLTLYIHGASSLKEKRQVLRKVTDRLRARFNVGVAEVGDNDIWQRAVVGIVAVANDSRFINEVLDKCARDAGQIAEIVNREMEIETYSEMKHDWAQKPDVDAVGGPEPQASDLGEKDDEDEGWLKEEDLP